MKKRFYGVAFSSLVLFMLFSPGRAEELEPGAAPGVPSVEPYYTIQVIILTVEYNVDRLVTLLLQKGYPAYVVARTNQKGEILYKVRIGKYRTRAEAEAMGRKFAEQEHKPYIVFKSQINLGRQPSETPAAAADQAVPQPPAVEAQPPGPAVPRVSSAAKHAEGTLPVKEQDAPLTEAGKHKEAARADNAVTATVPEQEPYFTFQVGAAPAEAPARPDSKADSWPETVTKIFVYRSDSGALNITNKYEEIPEAARTRIQHVSVFPVRYISPSESGTSFVFEVDGARKKIQLAGVNLSPAMLETSARSYLELNLKDVALRLKYNPRAIAKNGTLVGRIYLKEGTYINIDMLRRGFGSCCPETMPPGIRKDFEEAEATAKQKKAGMWATQAPAQPEADPPPAAGSSPPAEEAVVR